MQLKEEYGRLFYQLFGALELFVNRKRRIFEDVDNAEQLLALPPELRLECRRVLYAHPEHFDEFLAEGNLPASPDAADIVAGWRDHRIEGTFFVLRHLKRHTIFLSSSKPSKAYGVLGIADPLENLVPEPPAIVDTVLLPMRGQIVYDGILQSSGPALTFGGGIRRMFEDGYREAKARFGVITSLPHPAGATDDPTDDRSCRLKELMKSQRSRRLHSDEIRALRTSSPELEHVYHQERGKADARQIGRYLRDVGIAEGWFAIFEGIVIASAPDRARLAQRVAEILPESKARLPYFYRLKGK